jgi:endogenous inhibitor of DNA gyrase (YacG/DUF329 family)
MLEPDCPKCARPVIAVNPPPFMLHAELVIYRCPECVEEVQFWGEVIETPKHYMTKKLPSRNYAVAGYRMSSSVPGHLST